MFLIPDHIKFFKKDNCAYIINLLNGSEIILENDYEINKFLDLKSKSFFDKLDSDFENLLYQEEFIVNSELIYQSCLELEKILDSSMHVTIMPTENCNFCCSYCYQNHSKLYLSNEQLDVIKKYIIESISNYKINELSISWFGGEPLLRSKIIIDFNTFIKKTIMTKFPEVSLRIGITTNGYYLDVLLMVKLYNSGIRFFQITLDGFNHDKLRYLRSGKGTLQSIISNLLKVSKLDHSYDFFVSLRYNILSNDLDLTWYDYIYDLFGYDNRFSVSVYNVQEHDLSDKSLDYIMQNDRSLIEKHKSYIKKIGLNITSDFDNPLDNVCNAGLKHSYVFRANGDICKCTLFLNEKINIIGNVDNNKVVIYEQKHKKWYDTNITSKCLKCKKFSLCLNKSCPIKRIINDLDCWCV